MSVRNDRLHFLINRHIAGGLTEQELDELQRYNDTDIRIALQRFFDRLAQNDEELPDEAIPSEKIYQNLLQHPLLDRVEKTCDKSPSFPIHWGWAAGIAALLCIGIFFFFDPASNTTPSPKPALATNAHIIPGGNKATLKLPNGNTIALNEDQSSIIVDGDRITYSDGTQLLDNKQTANSYLELSAPRGGTYHITLDDGTEVWLNADSRFRYPSRFTGSQRIVELDGEAYFSVTKYARKDGKGNMPFLVKTKFQTVEVLGTQFNISAYPDEATERTTLVEGSVKITGGNGTTKQLYPNQQGRVTADQTQITNVDINNFTAWKDGYFAFSDTHIRDVMKVIARWYDIEVDYADDSIDARFGGTISRFSDFETLLQTIELTGSVKFKITGRRVTIMT